MAFAAALHPVGDNQVEWGSGVFVAYADDAELMGTVHGSVTTTGGQPAEGAEVAFSGAAMTVTATAGADGTYDVALVEGDYEATTALEGYREAVRAAGHEVDPALIAPDDFTYEGGAAAMEQLLEAAPDLDGVFAASDLMAAGAMGVLLARGRRVPEDVALVGFDDSPIAATTRPPLSSISQPIEEMGPEDPALIVFTSGTTGDPRGVVHGYRYLLGQEIQATHWFGSRPGELAWCTTATGWSKSTRNVFLAPWLCGAAAMIVDGRFEPHERLELIEREGVDVLCQAPTEYRVLAKRTELRRLPSVRRIRSKLELVHRFHGDYPGRVLDVGAGDGEFLERLAHLGWDVEGTDFSAEAARLTSERLGGRPIHVGPFEEVEVNRDDYHLITMWDVLEHLYHPLAALKKALQRGDIARKDRVMVISTANGLKFTDFKVQYHLRKIDGIQSQLANDEIVLPPKEVVEKTSRMYRPEVRRPMGVLEWPAMRRLADRIDPSYKN